MPPVSPENASFQQVFAEATACLRDQIRQDIAALRQSVDDADQLILVVQRQRAAVLCAVDMVRAPMSLGEPAADE